MTRPFIYHNVMNNAATKPINIDDNISFIHGLKWQNRVPLSPRNNARLLITTISKRGRWHASWTSLCLYPPLHLDYRKRKDMSWSPIGKSDKIIGLFCTRDCVSSIASINNTPTFMLYNRCSWYLQNLCMIQKSAYMYYMYRMYINYLISVLVLIYTSRNAKSTISDK